MGPPFYFPTQVLLNVYDLTALNKRLCPIGLGIHHTEVEIDGQEYSYANKIIVRPPLMMLREPRIRLRYQLDMGSFHGGKKQLKKVLHELMYRCGFRKNGYCLLRRNCNHFCDALLLKLVQRKIPKYVNRLAKIGFYCLGCFLPPNTESSSNEDNSSYIFNVKNKAKIKIVLKTNTHRRRSITAPTPPHDKQFGKQRQQQREPNGTYSPCSRQSGLIYLDDWSQEKRQANGHGESKQNYTENNKTSNDSNTSGMRKGNNDARETFGVKANGESCKSCIRQGKYCWQHKLQDDNISSKKNHGPGACKASSQQSFSGSSKHQRRSSEEIDAPTMDGNSTASHSTGMDEEKEQTQESSDY